MSGECDKCSEHCVDCKCASKDMHEPLCRRQQNGSQHSWTINLNKLKKRIKHVSKELKPLGDGQNPPAEQIPTKWINVNGRKEHEALLKDSKKCEELGLDQYYEIMVYLRRWGSWLDIPEKITPPKPPEPS